MMGAIHKDLFPFQKEGAVWLSTLQNAILGDEMRVGKTPTAIAGADIIGARNILVVCPGIARVNWEREFRRWQMLLRDTCCIMSSKDRPTGEVIIVSYELICTRAVLEPLVTRRWDLIVVDEAHLVKNPESLRTQVLYGRHCDATKGLASRAKRVWLLSGTPIPNGLHEMWAHARALFPKAVKGLESYSAWMNHFCYTERGDFGVKVMGALQIEDFVERFHPYIKRRMLRDVQPDLPPIRYSNVVVQPDTVPVPLAHVIEQETVLRAALARARGGAGTDGEVAALAAIDTMHISSLHKWTGITKAPAVADYVASEMQQGLRKVVIFAKHSEVFEVLKKTLPGRGAVINGQTATNKRQPIIDEFQDRVPNKTLDWIAVHIDIASTAIDLTAANDVVFAETTWVPKDVQQAAMRCMGINQSKPVLARIMSLKGSIDEAISETIVRKSRTISKIETRFTN
jgi:SWI/SNF-related matrix-associated actin-dependent regulator of chromatin subfamily A-like protein 1